MRQQLVQTDTIDRANDIAPWACEIVEVDDGFMAFESQADYETFVNQQ